MWLPRNEAGTWIKCRTLSLIAGNQGIRLRLSPNGGEEVARQGIGCGEESRKRATRQHNQQEEGEHCANGDEYIRERHACAHAGPARWEQSLCSLRKYHSVASLASRRFRARGSRHG